MAIFLFCMTWRIRMNDFSATNDTYNVSVRNYPTFTVCIFSDQTRISIKPWRSIHPIPRSAHMRCGVGTGVRGGGVDWDGGSQERELAHGGLCLMKRPCEFPRYSWWRHQMETVSALLTICAGNSPVPGEFPAQRPVTRSFDVFFDLHPNKRLSKQWWGWWFEPLSSWRHHNVEMEPCQNFYSSGCLPPCPLWCSTDVYGQISFIVLWIFACIASSNFNLSVSLTPAFFELCWFLTTTDVKRANKILQHFTCPYRNTLSCNTKNCKLKQWI